jgi:predicted nicotinamide N-methyase
MESLMKLQKRKIKITNDKWVYLNEQTLFIANGEEGLHLWEASVVMSRYINKYAELFENKQVLELGSGCGLVGLAALLYTNCQHLVFSDYQDSILDNLIKNIQLNKLNHEHIINKNFEFSRDEKIISHCVSCLPGRYSILKLDWRDYLKYKTENYDFLLGSELIYAGGHIEELVKLMRNLLSKSGKALIMMPEKRSQTQLFIKLIEENGMAWKCSEILEDDLFDQVLEDEKESKKLFENLKSMKILLYEIWRNIEDIKIEEVINDQIVNN